MRALVGGTRRSSEPLSTSVGMVSSRNQGSPVQMLAANAWP